MRLSELGRALRMAIGLAAALTVADARAGEDDLAWAVIRGSSSTSGSGNISDWKTIGRLRRGGARDVLYARLENRRYTFSDPALIRRVEALTAKDEETSREEARLAREQERLSKTQGDLDERESALEERMEALEAEADFLAERAGADRSRRAELRRRSEGLREEYRRLEARMQELVGRMAAVEAEEQRLEGRAEILEREQEQRFEIASREIHVLLRQAVDRGLGSPIR